MVILIKINNNKLGFFLFYGIKYMYRIFVYDCKIYGNSKKIYLVN